MLHTSCSAAKLEALGLAPSQRKQWWRQRLADLDALISCLGLPATYALLALAPASSAATMAAEALSRIVAGHQPEPAAQPSDGHPGATSLASSSSSTSAAPGTGLTCADAAALVRWYRALKADRLPGGLAQALEMRGLPVRRLPGSRS